MRKIYRLESTSQFNKELKKILKTNSSLGRKFDKVFEVLMKDPRHPGLRTHKVNLPLYKIDTFSSRVSGDLRIIWTFKSEKIVLLLTTGGHDDVY